VTVQPLYTTIRRILVFAVGSTVLLIGGVLLFTPGPAFVVIPIGLAILAIEFAWARRWLRKVRNLIERRGDGTPPPDSTPPSPSGGSQEVGRSSHPT
jgi:uncharacterized protein (TIGR02611 family)